MSGQMDHNVQLPRGIWDRINWWSVITTVVVSAFVFGTIYSKIDNEQSATRDKQEKLEERVNALVAAVNENFTDLKDIPYRVQLTEKSIDDIKRSFTVQTDRLAEKLDKVLDNQAGTDTKVEVVRSQVDDIKKSISGKIVWREGPLFPIPLLREISFKPCYLPQRPGYTVVKSYYRQKDIQPSVSSVASRWASNIPSSSERAK